MIQSLYIVVEKKDVYVIDLCNWITSEGEGEGEGEGEQTPTQNGNK